MRQATIFYLALSLTILVATPVGMPSTYDYYVRRRAIPEPVAQAFSDAWGAFAAAAFTLPLALLLVTALAPTKYAAKTRGKPWPMKSTLSGIVFGVCIAAGLDAQCIRAMRNANMQSSHGPPGYIFCVLCGLAALAGIAVMAYVSYSATAIERIPPGGFNQEGLRELLAQGELSPEEYERCRAAVSEAEAQRRVALRQKHPRP